MMSQILKQNRLFIIGLFISLTFVLINLLTLNWYPLPWVDEVSTADTAINVALQGKWVSTVWHYSYNPLHAFLLIPWVWIFGVSHISVTSFNFVFAFILCLLLLRLLIKEKIITTLWSALLYLMLFWGAGVLSLTYRYGRIDVLIMVLTLFVTVEILNFKNFSSRNFIRLLLFSFLLFLAGIPSIPFILFLLFILFISQKDYRMLIFKQGLTFILACFAGFLLVSLFYKLQNYMLHYWGSFITFNATITHKQALIERVIQAYKLNPEALLLSVVNLVVLLQLIYRKVINLKSIISLFVVCSMLLPLIMTLAGRYVIYYSWIFYIPVFIMTLLLYEKSTRYFNLLISLAVVFVFVAGFPLTLLKADRGSVERVNRFMEKQPITTESCVISDHVPYYTVKNKTNKCYFPGAEEDIIPIATDFTGVNGHNIKAQFKEKLVAERRIIVIDKIDFIIKSPISSGSEALDKFISRQLQLGNTVTAIDSMDNPKIIVYRVIATR